METSKNTQMQQTKADELLRFSKNRANMPFQEDDTGLLHEKLMDRMQSNPLGRLLKVIAKLPEVRVEKIEQGRRRVEESCDCWDTQMDVVLDRVLEDLINEE